jgi:Short C-terminal domain
MRQAAPEAEPGARGRPDAVPQGAALTSTTDGHLAADLRVRLSAGDVQAGDPYGDLMRLKELLDAGALTRAEFDTQKQKILSA